MSEISIKTHRWQSEGITANLIIIVLSSFISVIKQDSPINSNWTFEARVFSGEP